MATAVGWFEIYVDDMARARAFYEKVFGVKLSKMEMPGLDMWAFPRPEEGEGISGALIHMKGFQAGANSVLVYFGTPDCGEYAQRAVKAGGKIQKDKTSIGEHGFFSLVYDTEGNMIGLHSLPEEKK